MKITRIDLTNQKLSYKGRLTIYPSDIDKFLKNKEIQVIDTHEIVFKIIDGHEKSGQWTWSKDGFYYFYISDLTDLLGMESIPAYKERIFTHDVEVFLEGKES